MLSPTTAWFPPARATPAPAATARPARQASCCSGRGRRHHNLPAWMAVASPASRATASPSRSSTSVPNRAAKQATAAEDPSHSTPRSRHSAGLACSGTRARPPQGGRDQPHQRQAGPSGQVGPEPDAQQARADDGQGATDLAEQLHHDRPRPCWCHLPSGSGSFGGEDGGGLLLVEQTVGRPSLQSHYRGPSPFHAVCRAPTRGEGLATARATAHRCAIRRLYGSTGSRAPAWPARCSPGRGWNGARSRHHRLGSGNQTMLAAPMAAVAQWAIPTVGTGSQVHSGIGPHVMARRPNWPSARLRSVGEVEGELAKRCAVGHSLRHSRHGSRSCTGAGTATRRALLGRRRMEAVRQVWRAPAGCSGIALRVAANACLGPRVVAVAVAPRLVLRDPRVGLRGRELRVLVGARGHHGNGPQIGLLALQSEAYPKVRPYPLDVLGAESEA
jgi:hypothetical protein